jgi:class 3 adenylate cyclase
MLRFFRGGYRRLGPRYPRAVLTLQLQAAHIVVLAGIGLLSIYQPLTGHFGKVLLVGELLMVIENALAYRFMSRLLACVDPWLQGDHSAPAAAEAWRGLAELPSRFARRWKLVPVAVNVIPFCLFVTWDLRLAWHSFFFLFAGGLVALAYGLFLRFFANELALRPVIEDVSRDLPEDFDLGRAGISLRARLLLALPLLNVIAGVTVAGLSTDGTATLPDLGLDVAVAVAVAFTLSLELTLLLARSVADPISQLRRATEQVARGDLAVRVPVASTDETGRLAQTFNYAVSGLQERQRLREAFGAYVDPGIAERVLAEGVDLQGEEVEVSVLFVDIRDFTALAERSSAAELVGVLNAFFDTVVPIITEHGGHANKFVGDGLLGVFGAPDRRPDHADRAIAAAIAIARLVRARTGDMGIAGIGIGVNSGPVIAGTVGGGGRVEFTVIGDPVNTAARVEEATRISGDEVLVTAGTVSLARKDFGGWIERPPLPLKGKAEPAILFAPRVLADPVGTMGPDATLPDADRAAADVPGRRAAGAR